jgi:hypothetical protein
MSDSGYSPVLSNEATRAFFAEAPTIVCDRCHAPLSFSAGMCMNCGSITKDAR